MRPTRHVATTEVAAAVAEGAGRVARARGTVVEAAGAGAVDEAERRAGAEVAAGRHAGTTGR